MIIETDFKPAWWLTNSHFQTIYPALFRSKLVPANIKRERLTTPDNDVIDIDWCGEGDKPLVILLHGLTGSSGSGYIIGLQKELMKQDLRSVALNFRGCSDEPNQLARGYHSGDTGDIDFLFNTLRHREPETAIAVIGFSIGGNVLLKWLGERGNNLSLSVAVAVSVPLVLHECATKLDTGFSKIYRNSLLRELKDYISGKERYLEKIGNVSELDKIKQLGKISAIQSFWQYDDQVVATLHGYENVQQYYQLSSSRQFLHAIRVPTLLIHSADDPFMTKDVIPELDELSSYVHLEVTKGGGHVGFVDGKIPFKPRYWLEQRIPEFLKEQGFYK